jgi:hypothetical protein
MTDEGCEVDPALSSGTMPLSVHTLPRDGSHKDSFSESLETLSAVESQSWVSFCAIDV